MTHSGQVTWPLFLDLPGGKWGNNGAFLIGRIGGVSPGKIVQMVLGADKYLMNVNDSCRDLCLKSRLPFAWAHLAWEEDRVLVHL